MALPLSLAERTLPAIMLVPTGCGVCVTDVKSVQKKPLIFVLFNIIYVANHVLSLNLYSTVASRHALGYSLGRSQSFKSKIACLCDLW